MPTIIVRRDALDHISGWFDERFNMVEDGDLFMRLAYYYPIAYVDEVLAHRRMHAASWTSMKKELFPKEEEMLLAKFASLWPSFESDYAKEIAHEGYYPIPVRGIGLGEMGIMLQPGGVWPLI